MEDRELEFLIGDLEQENRLLRARNERLEKELAEVERLEKELTEVFNQLLAKAEAEITRLKSNT
jgi:cell division septum initiation protein DivIVA